MRKFTTLMAGFLLLIASQAMLAQHSGHDMGSMSGMGSMNHDDSAMKQMQKAVAVQATAEQRSQFDSWSQHTGAVVQQLQELRQAVTTSNYMSQLDAFKAAVEKSNSGQQEFLSSLTATQRTGLKKPIQNIGKANEEVGNATTITIRELGKVSSGAKRAAKLEKVEKALKKLLADQKAIAVEMGIA